MVLRMPPKTVGFDFNFFQKTVCSWAVYGGGAHDGYSSDLLIPFSTQGILLLNETPSTIVKVSFNGQSDHDELNSLLPSQGVAYDNRVVCGVWFKITTGASAVISCRAWGIR
jgi:hypothetical protein